MPAHRASCAGVEFGTHSARGAQPQVEVSKGPPDYPDGSAEGKRASVGVQSVLRVWRQVSVSKGPLAFGG